MMKVLAIAVNVVREAVRDKILYSILFFACLAVGLASMLGSFSIGNQIKFAKDFGLMAVSLFGVVIAIVLGVNLLHKELSKRTILNILSKPVARWQFIAGKFVGLWATVGVIVTLMGLVLIGILAMFEGQLDWGLLPAVGTVLLELMLVIAVALFFSSIVVTPSLAGLLTVATFIVGRSAGYLRYFFTDEYPSAVQRIARFTYALLPHLDRFNIADQVVYGDSLDPGYLGSLLVYSIAYAGFLLLISIGLFSRRQFS